MLSTDPCKTEFPVILHRRFVSRPNIHFAGHHLNAIDKCRCEVSVESRGYTKAAGRGRDSNSVDIPEVRVPLTEPAIVRAGVGQAGSQADEKSGLESSIRGL